MTTTIDAAVIMSVSEWAAEYHPVINPRGGTLTFDWEDDLDATFIKNVDVYHVWTELDEDEGDGALIVPGRRWENFQGYIVTMVPWTDSDADLAVVGDDPDDFDDDSDDDYDDDAYDENYDDDHYDYDNE